MKGNIMTMKAVRIKKESLNTISNLLGIPKDSYEVLASARTHYIVTDFSGTQPEYEVVTAKDLHNSCIFTAPETNQFVEIKLR
jgi:hypothetical protein